MQREKLLLNRFALAAAAARSNYGMQVGDWEQKCSQSAKSLNNAVGSMFNDLIESEDMFDSFLEEAEMWYNKIKNKSDDELKIEFCKFTILTGE
jgi:hypothetical protein